MARTSRSCLHARAAQAGGRVEHPAALQHDPRGELLVASERPAPLAPDGHVHAGRGTVRGLMSPAPVFPHHDDSFGLEMTDGKPASLRGAWLSVGCEARSMTDDVMVV